MSPVLEFEVRLQAAERRKDALRLRGDLRDALLDAGAVRADEVDVDQPEPGRRSAAVDIIGLVVQFAGTFAAAIQVMQGWQRKKKRDETDKTLTLTVDGVTVTLSEVPTPAELEALQKLIDGREGRADHER
ncbi:hypothetical protein OU415_16710 [Saccharopolyspora sp. WRP15-2]|uniref:Uncharacterized protein n=1 Tax=Saccharopolyspora oryzae TaxID=2997343 RepID=A0ABT4UZG1_9PSEU|nr:hypothetical protein [Saccharopolyspora oryzae]MDA3627088.1 hypothetical protein [Saccharopolyspora oryzae]